MRRSHLVFAFCAFGVFASAQGENIPAPVFDNLRKTYSRAVETMKKCSPMFAAHESDSTMAPTIETMAMYEQPKSYVARGDLMLKVTMDSLRLYSVLNIVLFDSLKKNAERQKKTTLDHAAAIERARTYCKLFGIEVPPDFKLTDAGFNARYASRWEIRWGRFSGPYRWGASDWEVSENMVVIFHETHGLELISCIRNWPPPKSLEVTVSSEQAVAKASKYVPLVQRTPFYKQSRMDGFVATAVKSCELRVIAPNWLLDPKRAVWIRNGPPTETRLCWVVVFGTVDSKATERNLTDKDGERLQLSAPDFKLYIDAATGEVVGASFT